MIVNIIKVEHENLKSVASLQHQKQVFCIGNECLANHYILLQRGKLDTVDHSPVVNVDQ